MSENLQGLSVDFRAAILAEMQRRGLNETDLAKASGVERSVIAKYLAGRRAGIRTEALEKLFGALGLVVVRSEGVALEKDQM